jgi:hypothetical protein
VERADDVRRIPSTLLDHGLPVAADIGEEPDVFVLANQHATVLLLGQHVKITGFRHHQFVTDVVRTAGEQEFLLTPVKRLVEIRTDRQLRPAACQPGTASQIGHPNPPEKMLEGELKKAPKRKTPDFTRLGRARPPPLRDD